MARIAFLGLGNMGLPMARNLVKAGHRVTGFDLFAAARERLAADGGTVAATPAEALSGAEAVVTMLPSGREVEAVYLGADGILALAPRGAVMIDSSTIAVATARKVAAAAGESGALLVDAPVSGGVAGAEGASLTFMVGGSESAFAAAKPFLEIMGKRIVHAGPPGSGQAAKICNNLLLAISMIGVSEAFVLARRMGLSEKVLFDIASTSSGQCWSLTSYCPVPGIIPSTPANRDYAPGFAVAMMLKDVKLAMEAARSGHAATPLGAAAERLYQELADAGLGGKDFSVVFEALDRRG